MTSVEWKSGCQQGRGTLHVSVLVVHGHGERLAQHLPLSLHVGQQLVTILNKVLTLSAAGESEGQQLQAVS